MNRRLCEVNNTDDSIFFFLPFLMSQIYTNATNISLSDEDILTTEYVTVAFQSMFSF